MSFVDTFNTERGVCTPVLEWRCKTCGLYGEMELFANDPDTAVKAIQETHRRYRPECPVSRHDECHVFQP